MTYRAPGPKRSPSRTCSPNAGSTSTSGSGPHSLRRTGRLADIAPADRLEVLSLLSGGGYDLIHYAGHGDFHAGRPDTVGWLFATGLLTSTRSAALDRRRH